jgi:hypothetical protein
VSVCNIIYDSNQKKDFTNEIYGIKLK